MFTGIVRELGRVVSAEAGGGGLALVVEAPETVAALATGDSVSVNGVCLTAQYVGDGRLSLHAVAETLARSTFGGLTASAGLRVSNSQRTACARACLISRCM